MACDINTGDNGRSGAAAAKFRHIKVAAALRASHPRTQLRSSPGFYSSFSQIYLLYIIFSFFFF